MIGNCLLDKTNYGPVIRMGCQSVEAMLPKILWQTINLTMVKVVADPLRMDQDISKNVQFHSKHSIAASIVLKINATLLCEGCKPIH